MHVYLTPWTRGTDGALYPEGTHGASLEDVRIRTGYGAEDLRPNLQRPDGFCFLFTRVREDAALRTSDYLGEEFDVRSDAVRMLMESRLGTTLDGMATPRQLLAEYAITKSSNLKPGASGYLCRKLGQDVFQVPVIRGGAGPYTDNCDATDGTEVNGRTWSGGTQVWEAAANNQFDINTNNLCIEATADYYGAWGNTGLDTSAHYAKAAQMSVADNADNNNWGGVLLRGTGDAVTLQYYAAALRPAADLVYLVTMNPGIAVIGTDAWVHGAQSDVAVRGFVDASHVFSLIIAGTERLSHTDSSIGTTNTFAGVFGRNAVARTTNWDDIEIGDGADTPAGGTTFTKILGAGGPGMRLAGQGGLAG